MDPLDLHLGAVFKRHFAYAERHAPADLEALGRQIADADAFVMVSPDYNHSMSPALAHLLNHLGGSRFADRPSAIVTYSAGQRGGARAAVGMRTFLSELGCLPVSAMVHVPRAQEVLTKTGDWAEGQDGDAIGFVGRRAHPFSVVAGRIRSAPTVCLPADIRCSAVRDDLAATSKNLLTKMLWCDRGGEPALGVRR